jgi:uncharacterized protein
MQKELIVSVFPFRDSILLPNIDIKVIINQETYLKLIFDCLKEGGYIAMGLGDPVYNVFGSKLQHLLRPKKVMAIGKPTIYETFSDGSIGVQIKSENLKVQINESVQNIPYLKCRSNIIEEVDDLNLLKDEIVIRLENLLNCWLRFNVHDEIERSRLKRHITTLKQTIDYICFFVIQDPELKQIYLEMNSYFEKATMLDLIFQKSRRYPESLYYGEIFKSFHNLESLNTSVQ